jgi:hypothetical protein
LRCLHAFAVIVGQQDDLLDAIANGEAAEVSDAKAGARFATRDLAVGAGRFKALGNPHGAACEGGGQVRRANCRASCDGCAARYGIEEQALDRNQALGLEDADQQGWKATRHRAAPHRRRDGSAHRAAAR